MIYCFVLLQYVRIRIVQYKHYPPNFLMTACINMNRGCETIIIWWKINSGKQLHGTLASWNAKKWWTLELQCFFTLVSESECTCIPFLKAQSQFWLEDFPTATENNEVSWRNTIHELATKIYKKVKNSAKLRKQKLRHPYSQANMNKNIVTNIASFM